MLDNFVTVTECIAELKLKSSSFMLYYLLCNVLSPDQAASKGPIGVYTLVYPAPCLSLPLESHAHSGCA